MNPKRVVNHYLNLSQALRDNKITIEELNQTVIRDQQAFLVMKNKALITLIEYESLLQTVNEFEDLFETIIDNKVEFKSNGSMK